jgi:peptide/nickel transport system permease protein
MTFWRLYRRNISAVIGLIILLLVIGMAATASFWFPDDPFKLAGKPMSPPGENSFVLGSDTLGRDVAAGIAHGARTSLFIGGMATAVAVWQATLAAG